MAEIIEFGGNYQDLSTDKGFQFEFECQKCGCGYRTKFRASAIGTAASVLDAASGLFGGILGRAADIGESVRSSAWEKAHDQAFETAWQEVKESFYQCPKCSNWVCKKSCVNTKKGLCKQCSPDLGVEMAAAQSQKSVEEIYAHAAMAEEDKKLGAEHWREGVRATCPQCGATQQTNAKFCADCGASLKSPHCIECGEKLAPGAKFCPGCGKKV
ncbi:MAG: zinc ribbon domain-containing protein [Armatimonadota bacterium]